MMFSLSMSLEPSVGCFSIFNRQYFTAKPTPCSLFLYVFWHTMPEESLIFFAASAKSVFCSATMSTSSLWSSLQITDQIIIIFKSFEMAVSIVQTFPVPNLRSGKLILTRIVLHRGELDILECPLQSKCCQGKKQKSKKQKKLQKQKQRTTTTTTKRKKNADAAQ